MPLTCTCLKCTSTLSLHAISYSVDEQRFDVDPTSLAYTLSLSPSSVTPKSVCFEYHCAACHPTVRQCILKKRSLADAYFINVLTLIDLQTWWIRVKSQAVQISWEYKQSQVHPAAYRDILWAVWEAPRHKNVRWSSTTLISCLFQEDVFPKSWGWNGVWTHGKTINPVTPIFEWVSSWCFYNPQSEQHYASDFIAWEFPWCRSPCIPWIHWMESSTLVREGKWSQKSGYCVPELIIEKTLKTTLIAVNIVSASFSSRGLILSQ